MKWNVACLSLFALLFPAVATACMSVGINGLPVSTASETAIIVWDAKNHEEHFIRMAHFMSDARSIGFLVPTPSLPKLTEVKEDAFNLLDHYVRRRLKVGPETKGGITKGAMPPLLSDPVIRISHVGSYEETVLSLENPNAAEKWLKKNGFPVSKKTKDWIGPYAKSHWFITAFRMESTNGSSRLKPVDLTFHTGQPFYPYREPASSKDGDFGRSLRVYFLSDGPANAKMGDETWVGKAEVSDELTEAELSELAPTLPSASLSNAKWLTSFYDPSNPRIGTSDVTFSSYSNTPLIWAALAVSAFIVVILGNTKRLSKCARD